MTVGEILLIALAVIIILGIIGFWIKKRNPGTESGNTAMDKAMDNAVDLNDRFNRARQINQQDGR